MVRRKKTTTVDLLLPEVSDQVKGGIEQSLQWEHYMEKMSVMANALTERQHEVALIERKKDIEYVEKIDDLLSVFLNSFTEVIHEDEKLFKGYIRKAFETGKFNQIRDMMISMLGIPLDKREMLLGFDETRQKKRSDHVKLEVVWKNNSGEQCGVRIEKE